MSTDIARVAVVVDALMDTLDAINERVIVSALAAGMATGDIGALKVGAALPLDLTTNHIPARGTPKSEKCKRGYAMYASEGGSVAKLQGVGRGGVGSAPGIRGTVGDFSKGSRKRMLQTLGSIDKTGCAPPLFAGLTYPGDHWPDDPAQWAQDIENLYARLCRHFQWANIAIIWRKEPQKRGAPHFHLFIFGVEFIAWQWLGATWADITGGNPKTCSKVEKLRSWRGAMFYASKYMAKRADDDDGRCFTTATGTPLTEVGRHWGVMGRKHLPVSWRRYALALGQFHWLRRQIARYMRSKGRNHRTRGRSSGLWCFMPSEDVGRLLGAIAPYVSATADTPRL
jgi:hypothetical protein